nr:probable glucan 1,3-beta-glucosidase A [Tanacetum cinerariifolium]
EWLAEWQVRGASKEDFQRFSKAQLDVFGRASFGWAYWSLKNVNDHWSMEWMIKNGQQNNRVAKRSESSTSCDTSSYSCLAELSSCVETVECLDAYV